MFIVPKQYIAGRLKELLIINIFLHLESYYTKIFMVSMKC